MPLSRWPAGAVPISSTLRGRLHLRPAMRSAAWWLASKAARGLMRAELHLLLFRANSTQRYLDQCRPDGLQNSLNLRAFRADMEADYTRAAAIKQALQRSPQ
jgi:hypothetical protein